MFSVGVMKRIFYIVSFLLLTACSAKLPTSYLPINPEKQNTLFSKLTDQPPIYVYNATGKKEPNNDVLVTILRECSVDSNLSLAAAMRQTISGFEKLEGLDQKPMILSGMQAYYGLFNASLDGSPLILAVYSLRANDCLLQVNAWREVQKVPDGQNVRQKFENDIIGLWDDLEPQIALYFDDQYKGDS